MTNPPDAHRQQIAYGLPDPVEGIRCTFCKERSIGRARAMMERDGRRWAMVLSLCPEHLHILAAAGARGRVHGPTHTRYTLSELP